MGGLLLAGTLVACGTLRADLCATVYARTLEEERTTEEVPRHLSDPQACALRAERLRRLVGELRALEIRDATLRQAVERYLNEVEELAKGYALLSAAYHAPEAATGEALRRREALGEHLVEHVAEVDRARSILRRTCRGL
jgi:predicted RNase H-like nuclease (RuvC/YqgF family)